MVDHAFDPNRREGRGQEPSAAPGDGERVAKALARAGVASRRAVERLIEAGRVTLNGRVLDTPAVKVAPGDLLQVDGKAVAAAQPTRVWRYHKPVGLVTTHSDPKGRPTVFANLPSTLPRVISVGRLDLNTEGLLLLTNDGGLARALELPVNGLARRYRARARGHATQAKLDTLRDGLTVEGVRYGPIEARLDKAREGGEGPANLWITLSLNEGKNREVRKVLEALGLTVNRLIRLSYGPFALGTLAVGGVEEVGPRVIREQLDDFIAPENLPAGARTEATGPAAGDSRRGASARGGKLSAAGEPRKPDYKPGWARPAKRAGPPRAKTSKPKSPKAEMGALRTASPKQTAPKDARAQGAGPKTREVTKSANKPAQKAAKPRTSNRPKPR